MIGERPKQKGVFLRVLCRECETQHLIFNKVASHVTCQVCGATLAIPTGGKSRIRGRITGVFK